MRKTTWFLGRLGLRGASRHQRNDTFIVGRKIIGPGSDLPKVRKLLLGPHSWLVDGERVATHRVSRHHDPVVWRPEEQIVSVPRPLRVRAAVVRDLPLLATVWERPHIRCRCLAAGRSAPNFLASWCPNEKRLLFSNRRGNPYSENKVLQKRLWPILDALSIPRCGMHAFRHGHGSLMHSSGVSLKVAQMQLRHADASTTSRYYLHVLGSEQRDAAEKVARILCPDVAKAERKSVHCQLVAW